MTLLLRHLGLRLLYAVPQLLGILIVSFFLLKLIPGDPAPMMLGPLATQEAVDKLRAEMGLDQPLPLQLLSYLAHLLHGDFGDSWQTTHPVLHDLIERLPATLELVTLGLLLAVLIGFPLGVAAAQRPQGLAGRSSDLFTFGIGALPDFWLALVFIYLFYTVLGWAPAPLGRLDFAVLPPPRLTGSYALDALLAGDWYTLRAAAGQLVLPF
jgi:peptide/nickel transport system permease protein